MHNLCMSCEYLFSESFPGQMAYHFLCQFVRIYRKRMRWLSFRFICNDGDSLPSFIHEAQFRFDKTRLKKKEGYPLLFELVFYGFIESPHREFAGDIGRAVHGTEFSEEGSHDDCGHTALFQR